MQDDDELVEKVRAGIVRQTAYAHPQADWHDVAARAAIAVMREAGYVKQPPGKLPMWTDDPNRCVSGATFHAISK